MNLLKFFRRHNPEKGFSLIEVLVIAVISIYLTVNLLSNVLRTRLNISETVRIMVSDIRAAQANALASKQIVDPATGLLTYRCGYGINRTGAQTYQIYAGRLPQTGGCDANNNQYGSSQDTPTFQARVLDSRLELYNPTGGSVAKFDDIYFKSPDAKIYIKNQHQPSNRNNNKSQIIIRKINATCPSSNCTYICVYSSGKIETRLDACPDF